MKRGTRVWVDGKQGSATVVADDGSSDGLRVKMDFTRCEIRAARDDVREIETVAAFLGRQTPATDG